MRKVLSERIAERLETHPLFCRAHTVLLYHSLNDEPATHALIDRAYAAGKHILLPVVEGDCLCLYPYSGPEYLTTGPYGIREPANREVSFTRYEDIDLAVVPGVAFDNQGNRIGRGKGYYDRLLPRISACKIGVCFPFQLTDITLPVTDTDVPMNEVICQ